MRGIVSDAVQQRFYSWQSLRHLLEQEMKRTPPEIDLVFPHNKEVRELSVRSHALDIYDEL
ncbi:MAG: hypothetical protein H7318_05130 [Oligoflexus sp.]|nr:hypothetical protein [Oligoflexus sp.]